jgi:hypothetical protein
MRCWEKEREKANVYRMEIYFRTFDQHAKILALKFGYRTLLYIAIKASVFGSMMRAFGF